jgi:hypothetical protein
MSKKALPGCATKLRYKEALRNGATALGIAFAVALLAVPGHAQTCESQGVCNQVAIGEITQQRVGTAFTGGNPVAGASSTLGMRLGALPRISVGVRASGLKLTIPNAETSSANDELSSFIRSTNVDAAVGVFSGLSLLPTVGGFGSVDLLASYGTVSLPDDDGYGDGPSSWGAGIRVGILRESFTAPGIAVSAMYRGIGDVVHTMGQPELDNGSITTLENNSVLSLRGTVGKRILMLGAVAGVGYDRYSSDARIAHFGPTVNREISSSTTTLFANLSWTMLILNIVGEGGVLRGDENTYFGSLAIRLAL